MIPVMSRKANKVKLYNFSAFTPDSTIYLKYGMKSLVVDTKPGGSNYKIYKTTLKDFEIVDELASSIVFKYCTRKNNAFVLVQSRFYVYNDELKLPDDYMDAHAQ